MDLHLRIYHFLFIGLLCVPLSLVLSAGFTWHKGLYTKQDLHDIFTESRRLLPMKTCSMWTTLLLDDGNRARRLSFPLYSA
jgi:hypothetical protein